MGNLSKVGTEGQMQEEANQWEKTNKDSRACAIWPVYVSKHSAREAAGESTAPRLNSSAVSMHVSVHVSLRVHNIT